MRLKNQICLIIFQKAQFYRKSLHILYDYDLMIYESIFK